MTQEKAKKRGRPAQLLQIAELHAFVEFLLEKRDRSELQNQVEGGQGGSAPLRTSFSD